MTSPRWLLGSLATLALLAACGGGGSGMPADTSQATSPLDQVSRSASQSVSGMTGYLKALDAFAPDNREPVDLGGFTPPTSDTSEPDPVS
jgi:hypothetical protein